MTEFEYEGLIESRMRLHMSARSAFMQGFSKEQWVNSDIVQNFAKKNNLDDEIEHFASFVWGHPKMGR